MGKIKKGRLSGKDVAKLMHNGETDPMGSYTGVADNHERPIQDADDL